MNAVPQPPLLDDAADEPEESVFSGRRRTSEADLDITPMIDVVFLLLIFFMVSSTMQSNKELDVPPALHGVGVDAQKSATISILKPVDPQTDPEILLTNGSPGTLEDVTADIAAQAGSLEDVIIKADRDVRSGFVMKVMRAVNEVEGVHLHVEVKDR